MSGVRWRDQLRQAADGIVARPSRLALTTIGIALGLAALVATLGIATTASAQVSSRFDAIAATQVAVQPQESRSPTAIVGEPPTLPVDAAERVRGTIREQAFDGEFFVDNAVRKDDKLEVTRNRTEVCQYYAFFFDVATRETHGPLWTLLREQFGPKRDTAKVYPEIHVTNHFIGNQLRLELLSRDGWGQQVLDESVDYNLYMADRTGTLWEHVGDYASCNHGFASHVAHVLYRDVLGVAKVDAVNRKVRLRFGEVAPEWCEGRIPTPAGPVTVRWWKAEGKLFYRADVPAGFVIEAQNLTARELVRRP